MKKSPHQIPGGIVIIFEGLDGVGKTTQLQLAAEALKARGWLVHTTRNLGGTPIGEALREVAFLPIERSPETDLYISVAVQTALAESLAQERQQGKVILLDRGPLSLAAYHIYGNGLDSAHGWQHAKEGMKKFHPELVILYTADVQTALQRNKQTRKTDYYEKKPRGYFERVNRGFEAAAKLYQTHIIDADQPIASVHTETMAAIDKLLANIKTV